MRELCGLKVLATLLSRSGLAWRRMVSCAMLEVVHARDGSIDEDYN